MIPKTFEEAFTEVIKLTNEFEKHEEEILSNKDYQEANVRQDYLDKFFVALGWDVYHVEQPNPYEREVSIEQNITVGGRRGKKADYAFFITPDYQNPKLIAEAKKPSHKMENKDYCFQTLRYGWNSNTPLAILTDFEEFLILDSRYKPSIETALERIHKTFHYKDFADEEKFREVYFLFSREAVGDNAIEKYAEGLKKARGVRKRKLFNTAIIEPVDEEFLNELDEQRENLAKGFKNKNPDLDGEALTEITQRTLDRLVFIRFLEDKLVEPSEIIDNLGTKTGSAWRDFVAESRRLDRSYNGIIFKEHQILDAKDFSPDERTFENIRDWLSHKNSPYDFNTIPIHILGSAYERFLGKTITATDKRAKVEEKPEVRKAGGVYYTPEYIVRYIVENTIGKLCEGKTPEEIAEMRFADIACGSGSFLLGVFDYLIEYHVKWFSGRNATVKERAKRRRDAIKRGEVRETQDGTLQLTLEFKREILLNNIYGVDLDAQAVEVAQLSLYLKLLEEETTATAQQYLAGLREQMLPSLNNNIVHGNSLIDFDIMDGMLFDAKDLRKLNPMNFEQTFPEVFKKGGFDAIVGNPPYVILGKDLFAEHVTKYLDRYEVAQYKVDLFHLFIQKGIDILNENGKLGFIIPNTWLTLKFTNKLRKYVLENTSVEELVTFDHQVFQDATVHTALLFLRNEKIKNHQVKIKKVSFADKIDDLLNESDYFVKQESWQNNEGDVFETRFVGSNGKLVKRILDSFPKLGEKARASLGCQAYNSSKHTKEQIKTRAFHSETKVNDEYLPELAGSDVSRYEIERKKGKWIHYGSWLHDYRTMDWLEGPRILIREISSKPPYSIQASYVEETYCNYKTILNVNPSSETDFSMKYLVGILNSKLISFIYPYLSNKIVTNTFPRMSVGDVRKLPIRTIDFDNRRDKERHDALVELVEKMLVAKKNLSAAQTDKDLQFYERYCSSLDLQIDNLVYDLYELTQMEIAIVEGK